MGINFFCWTNKAYFSNCFKLGFFLFFSTLLLASCSISKPTYIFKDIVKDTVIKGFTDTDIELKIQKNDLLSLQISSLNSLEDALFNSTKASIQGDGAAGYLVNLDGNIYLHKLGSILVAGMTRNELKIKLEKDLLPYLKDPIVTVSFANHFITVMGEVGGSQILNMPAEKISLIDAIAKTGKITENATLKNVMSCCIPHTSALPMAALNARRCANCNNLKTTNLKLLCGIF